MTNYRMFLTLNEAYTNKINLEISDFFKPLISRSFVKSVVCYHTENGDINI